jgi:hypothetical protein
VADARGNEHRIARRHRQRLPRLATEADRGGAGGDAEHLVDVGMVVVEGVDAVPPAAAPAVPLEEGLEGLRRIAGGGVDGALVDDQRQHAVGNVAVVGEDDCHALHDFVASRDILYARQV